MARGGHGSASARYTRTHDSSLKRKRRRGDRPVHHRPAAFMVPTSYEVMRKSGDLGLVDTIIESYRRHGMIPSTPFGMEPDDAPKNGRPLPLVTAAGKKSRDRVCYVMGDVLMARYWTPALRAMTPPVICVDIDRRDAIPSGLARLRATNLPNPSAIIVNPENGRAQFQWFLGDCYSRVEPITDIARGKIGALRASGDLPMLDPGDSEWDGGRSQGNPDWREVQSFREIQRSLTAVLGGDFAFANDRMRNPNHVDSHQQVLLLHDGARDPRRYGIPQLAALLRSAHAYFSNERVLKRYNMMRRISKDVSSALSLPDSPTALTEASFVPTRIIHEGERNRTLSGILYSACYSGFDPARVANRIYGAHVLEGDFPRKEMNAIVRAARKRVGGSNGSKRTPKRTAAQTAANGVGLDAMATMLRYVITRDAQTERRCGRNRGSKDRVIDEDAAGMIRDIAASYGRKGGNANTRLQKNARESNLKRGNARRRIIGAMNRGAVLDAMLTLRDCPHPGDTGIARIAMFSIHGRDIRSSIRLDGKGGLALPRERRTAARIRRWIAKTARDWLYRSGILGLRDMRRIAERAGGGIRGEIALVVRACSLGFEKAMDDGGYIIRPDDLGRENLKALSMDEMEKAGGPEPLRLRPSEYPIVMGRGHPMFMEPKDIPHPGRRLDKYTRALYMKYVRYIIAERTANPISKTIV